MSDAATISNAAPIMKASASTTVPGSSADHCRFTRAVASATWSADILQGAVVERRLQDTALPTPGCAIGGE